MIGERPRAVFDCNILLQAALSETGPSAAALRLLDSNQISLYVSRATLQELRSVLAYPTIRMKNPNLTDLHASAFVQRVTFKATLIRRVRHVMDYPRA